MFEWLRKARSPEHPHPPSGLHFGEGPFNLLGQDPMAAPLFAAAAALMQKLPQLTSGRR